MGQKGGKGWEKRNWRRGIGGRNGREGMGGKKHEERDGRKDWEEGTEVGNRLKEQEKETGGKE